MREQVNRDTGQPVTITKVDVLRVLRSRLDSIISGLDDCIAHGGQAGHPVLLNAGTVFVHGVAKRGLDYVLCQDSLGIVEAEFIVYIETARGYGLPDGDEVMADHDCSGPVDVDGYCELHGFKKIGNVSSAVGCFAIIDIGAGAALTDWFKHLTGNDIADPPEIREGVASGQPAESIPLSPALHQWAQEHAAARQQLEQFGRVSSHPVDFDGWKGLAEAGTVVNTEQGWFPVYARDRDRYGTGHMSICELRIDLHQHHRDDWTEAQWNEAE